MGHWLPLQQFGQVRTARGVAKITMNCCATVQVEETDVATQDGSDKSVQASLKSTFQHLCEDIGPWTPHTGVA